jgi:hypothetical protein
MTARIYYLEQMNGHYKGVLDARRERDVLEAEYLIER